MKKLILLIAVLCMISISYAQVLTLTDVPADVSKVFVKSHPKVTLVEWTKAGDNFKANYTEDSTYRSATYSSKGKITETEKQISVTALPSAAIKYLNENFSDGYAKKTLQIKSVKGKVTYSVNIKDVVLLFDSNGKYIKPTI